MSLRNDLLHKRPKVAIIGAGVIGIGTALALLQKVPYFDVTIYAAEVTPDTTGDGSAGFWYPYITGGTPEHNIRKWAEDTYNLLRSWYYSGDPEVIKSSSILLDDKHIPQEEWFKITKDLVYMSPDELKEYGDKYTCGIRFLTYISEPKKFLPHLMKSIFALGGRFVQRKVQHLNEFDGVADVVINCTGIGAHQLVPDNDVTPVRGQVIRVEAPWVNICIADATEDNNCYILPNTDTVILGGTHQEGNWSRQVDQDDKEQILEKCKRLIPSLKHAKIVSDWVGLRPMRSKGVRLEIDQSTVGHGKTTVIHNYGHGGSGVTLFWGCAREAAQLAIDAVVAKTGHSSKL